MEQPRVERVFRLMRLMTGNVYFTVEELAEKLETSYRSIYRYIDTFKELGFAVEKIRGNVYRIVKMPPSFKDLSKLVYFSDEEAKVLCNLIENLDSNHALKSSLYKKLAAIYDLTSINEFKGSKSNAGCIQAIGNAISEKKKVVLKNYASSNSGEVRDRLVEPFAFTNNHIDIWAFDTEKKENRIFKIPRIEWVDILSEDWEYEAEHHRKNIDDFRMSYEGEGVPVKLELSLRAKNLLVEEFPLAEGKVRREEDKWIYEGRAGHMEGVGRFCISLAGDVKVVDSPELSNYIRDYVQKNF
ncbi:MAG: WYL domain-containing protein [Bacteroidales bacterium]|nr:WYL domain-containing protein [Bacteroidales bacterium]